MPRSPHCGSSSAPTQSATSTSASGGSPTSSPAGARSARPRQWRRTGRSDSRHWRHGQCGRSSFMTNTLQWLPQLREGDVIRAPFADVRVATIDPDDIAAVAAAALTSDAHEGRAYRVSGPESLLPADRVAILAEVLDRELRFEGQPDEEARAEMSEAMPPEYVDAFFRFFADGEVDESQVLPTVEGVTGRPPRTFEQWARAHAEDFR